MECDCSEQLIRASRYYTAPMIDTPVEAVRLRSPPPVAPETPVPEAANHLREPDVPALPVLADGTLVGIVTDSDLVALLAETDDRPAVRAIMSTPVTTITPTATLHDAAETMRAAGVKHLPVVRNGRYRGMLSVDSLAPFLSRSTLDIEWHGDPLRIETDDLSTVTPERSVH